MPAVKAWRNSAGRGKGPVRHLDREIGEKQRMKQGQATTPMVVAWNAKAPRPELAGEPQVSHMNEPGLHEAFSQRARWLSQLPSATLASSWVEAAIIGSDSHVVPAGSRSASSVTL